MATGAITGFSSSVTVTLCWAVAVLPLPSVTVQITVVVPTGNLSGALLVIPFSGMSSPVTSGEPRSIPVASQVPKSLPTVIFAGAVMVLGRTSRVTVTVCSAVAVLPLSSVTVHVTVVMPMGNSDGASLVTEATPQLSEVSGVPKSTSVAESSSTPICMLILAGAVIKGCSFSKTVTVCSAVAVLLLPSVTVQVTIVIPTGKLSGASLPIPSPEISSPVAFGVPRSIPVASQIPSSVSTSILEGAVIVGIMQVQLSLYVPLLPSNSHSEPGRLLPFGIPAQSEQLSFGAFLDVVILAVKIIPAGPPSSRKYTYRVLVPCLSKGAISFLKIWV